MANIGFCDPGARVLEIQPEQFFEGWTRTACMIFGHRWFVFCAGSIPAEGDAATPPDKARGLTFTVDPVAMRNAIRTVRSA
jgi:capsular polysaccharide biosynthesis protein